MEEAASDPTCDSSNAVVCTWLLQPILQEGKGFTYTMFTDSKYPAIDLIESLKLGGIIPSVVEGTRTHILLTGTLSIKGTSARVGTPSSEGDYLAGSQSPLQWAEFCTLTKGDKHILFWHDSGLVVLISNAFTADHMGSVVRKDPESGRWTRVFVPYMQQAYTQIYDRVDYHNQVMKLCAAYKHVRTLRYTVKKTVFMKDCAMTNAYIDFRYAHPDKKMKTISKSAFVHAFVTEATLTMRQERTFFHRSANARLTNRISPAIFTKANDGHRLVDGIKIFWRTENSTSAAPTKPAPNPLATELEKREKISYVRGDGSKRGNSLSCVVCAAQLGPYVTEAREAHMKKTGNVRVSSMHTTTAAVLVVLSQVYLASQRQKCT